MARPIPIAAVAPPARPIPIAAVAPLARPRQRLPAVACLLMTWEPIFLPETLYYSFARIDIFGLHTRIFHVLQLAIIHLQACVEEKGKRGKFVGEEIDRLQWAPVVLSVELNLALSIQIQRVGVGGCRTGVRIANERRKTASKSLVPILYMAVMIVDIDQDLFRAPSWISRHARTSIQIDATSPISSVPPPTIRHHTQIIVEDSLPVVDDFIAAISDFFALDLRHWAPSTGIQIAVCSLRSGNAHASPWFVFILPTEPKPTKTMGSRKPL
ncbi:hypothetical protein OsJ_35838 [Oryza sativa Japonica Group]|uniref:Uncharacterized protein n=1 Tax=Oryza sativa subsp. japonica TaxID=39947 RepID=B9GCS5_ORYSJ|nr:hypothetical protein OsJ_35838 [Oryza sativa Japonica Group]